MKGKSRDQISAALGQCINLTEILYDFLSVDLLKRTGGPNAVALSRWISNVDKVRNCLATPSLNLANSSSIRSEIDRVVTNLSSVEVIMPGAHSKLPFIKTIASDESALRAFLEPLTEVHAQLHNLEQSGWSTDLHLAHADLLTNIRGPFEDYDENSEFGFNEDSIAVLVEELRVCARQGGSCRISMTRAQDAVLKRLRADFRSLSRNFPIRHADSLCKAIESWSAFACIYIEVGVKRWQLWQHFARNFAGLGKARDFFERAATAADALHRCHQAPYLIPKLCDIALRAHSILSEGKEFVMRHGNDLLDSQRKSLFRIFSMASTDGLALDNNALNANCQRLSGENEQLKQRLTELNARLEAAPRPDKPVSITTECIEPANHDDTAALSDDSTIHALPSVKSASTSSALSTSTTSSTTALDIVIASYQASKRPIAEPSSTLPELADTLTNHPVYQDLLMQLKTAQEEKRTLEEQVQKSKERETSSSSRSLDDKDSELLTTKQLLQQYEQTASQLRTALQRAEHALVRANLQIADHESLTTGLRSEISHLQAEVGKQAHTIASSQHDRSELQKRLETEFNKRLEESSNRAESSTQRLSNDLKIAIQALRDQQTAILDATINAGPKSKSHR